MLEANKHRREADRLDFLWKIFPEFSAVADIKFGGGGKLYHSAPSHVSGRAACPKRMAAVDCIVAETERCEQLRILEFGPDGPLAEAT